MNICIILSGGAGIRFGSKRKKQYEPLLGQEVIGYVVAAMKESALCDHILIVSECAEMSRLERVYGLPCVEGGHTRNHSVWNGLRFISEQYPACANVLFHDAVRPFLTDSIVDEYFMRLADYDAVITAQPITDSLGKVGGHVVDRSEFYLIQTPEAFRYPLLYGHFSPDSPHTAIVQQLPPGAAVYRHYGFSHNLKITYPEDLAYAEQVMAANAHTRALTQALSGKESV